MHRLKPPMRLRAAGPLVAVALLVLAPAVAEAVAVQTIVDVAENTYGMRCVKDAAQIDCSGPKLPWKATIKPGVGEEDSLETDLRPVQNATPMDATTAGWMIRLHQTACSGPKGAVDQFVNAVGTLQKEGTVKAANIGTCTFRGGLRNVSQLALVYEYWVLSAQLPPPPTPTPGPPVTATPAPTPKPTATPTTTPGPTVAAEATATPSTSATPGASPSPNLTPVPTFSPPASSSPVVVGPASGAPTSEPQASEAPGGGSASPAPSPPTFEGAVLGISEVNTDGGAVGGSALLALLLLLIIGFIGELFNNTVENNYDEIAGWFGKGPLGWFRRQTAKVRIDPPGVPGVWLFIGLTALVSSFVDPGFGLNVRSIAVFLGFLVGLLIVLASFKLPPILARRRRTGELGRLRPLPWALVIAALFVLVSRVENLQPGYLYGIVLGAIFVTDVSARDEGRESFYGTLWTLAAAVAGWLALTWLRGIGAPSDGFGYTLLSTACAATMVAGLEAAAFALMPLRFLPGYALYKWNRLAWAVLWGLSLFAFIHILIGPTSGYVSELSPQAFMAALGVFAAFGALSIATWLYFRFRNPPPAESVEAP